MDKELLNQCVEDADEDIQTHADEIDDTKSKIAFYKGVIEVARKHIAWLLEDAELEDEEVEDEPEEAVEVADE